jgi:hypothetical protein
VEALPLNSNKNSSQTGYSSIAPFLTETLSLSPGSTEFFPTALARKNFFPQRHLELKVKTIGKILGNFGSIFSYFWLFLYYLVNMIIDMKTGYGIAGIGRNTVRLSYRPFSDWPEKSDNFLDLFRIFHTVHLGFPVLFIWLGLLSFFLLIQRFFKYSNNLNLQNKKSVLIEL